MEWDYPTRYSDSRGVEMVSLRNDGARLSTRLRDVTFGGPDFDSLEPDSHAAPEALANFELHAGALCNCTIECKIPIPVVSGSKTTVCGLEMRLELGAPAANGGLDREVLTRKLKEEYSQVKDKFDLFQVLDRAEVVQETYLCPQFEKHLPHTGYRG